MKSTLVFLLPAVLAALASAIPVSHIAHRELDMALPLAARAPAPTRPAAAPQPPRRPSSATEANRAKALAALEGSSVLGVHSLSINAFFEPFLRFSDVRPRARVRVQIDRHQQEI
jgi:hypothetical protein